MSDHLTRAASCLLATATLFVAGTASLALWLHAELISSNSRRETARGR